MPTMTVEAEDLGTRLRRLRVSAGLTQEQLAREAGITTGNVAQLEQGKIRDPRLATIRAIARVLKVSWDTLVGPPEDRTDAAP